VINVTNFTSKNNPSYVLTEAVPPARPAVPAASAKPRRAAAPALRVRLGGVLVIAAGVLLSWLGAAPRRLGDRLFAMNDTEAYWRGWQIIKVQGGLGRRYRDSRFDTLAECASCRGSSGGAGAPCGRCRGTGRVGLEGVS
jgi:hypothetical protein